MDFLDNILNSMEGPPSTSEAQKTATRMEKTMFETRQNIEKRLINNFRKKVEGQINEFIKEGKRTFIQFVPMDQTFRSVLRDVAEIAGLQVYSFGLESVDRHCVVYLKDHGPSEDELTVRRSGKVWNKQKAAEMALEHLEKQKQALLDSEEANHKKRKHGEAELSGTFYKQKYAHLIGEDAALDAAQKTNMNKNYGEVPSANKQDSRSIEQTMADIKAKKMKKAEETDKEETDKVEADKEETDKVEADKEETKEVETNKVETDEEETDKQSNDA